MPEFDYDDLVRMIDLGIAASLERVVSQMHDDTLYSALKEEIEWLRMP